MSTSFIGISKILIVAGVGCGTVFYRNGRFSNLINRLQMLMKEVSPKYGDGAEVNVEDVDSTDVQLVFKGSTNSGDHVEGEDDADSADTQMLMKEVSLKYGDGAEVNVEDVDSIDVQLAFKGSTNSDDHVEGEDDADSVDTQMPMKVSLKCGDEAEVKVEDVDSNDVQFAVKGSTNSGDHVEGEDDADSADTQMFADMKRDLQRYFYEFTGLKHLDEHFKLPPEDEPEDDDLQRYFYEFTGLKHLDEHFKLPPEDEPEDDDSQMFANLKRDLQRTFDEITGMKDLDKSLDEHFKGYDQPSFNWLEE